MTQSSKAALNRSAAHPSVDAWIATVAARQHSLITLAQLLCVLTSSAVSQREMGVDFVDFTSGLRAALRQDPDVIFVGEMRDVETVEVAFARRVLEAIPDGRGVGMLDGKMQDDATWKQAKVMVDLAELLARKDPELAEAYGM